MFLDVETPIFSAEYKLRWRLGVSLEATTRLYPQEDSRHPFVLKAKSTQGHSAVGGMKRIKTSSDLVRN
jgi:hypothetical protein